MPRAIEFVIDLAFIRGNDIVNPFYDTLPLPHAMYPSSRYWVTIPHPVVISG